MNLYDEHSQSLTIWGITIAVLFVIMVIGMVSNYRRLRVMNANLKARVRNLFLSDMIERHGIPLKQYFEHTSDMDKEKHIWACEHCPKPDECIRMFSGEDISPETFCPNHHRLVDLKKSIKGAS